MNKIWFLILLSASASFTSVCQAKELNQLICDSLTNEKDGLAVHGKFKNLLREVGGKGDISDSAKWFIPKIEKSMVDSCNPLKQSQSANELIAALKSQCDNHCKNDFKETCTGVNDACSACAKDCALYADKLTIISKGFLAGLDQASKNNCNKSEANAVNPSLSAPLGKQKNDFNNQDDMKNTAKTGM